MESAVSPDHQYHQLVQSIPSVGDHDLYSHELQLKLYQAFIFSIPILFSIILFLLFYLFYLKRRAFSLSASPPPTTSYINHRATLTDLHYSCGMGLKPEAIRNKLPKVFFDEELKTRDSLCCVCLGEFEMEQELIQLPACDHIFHVECIHYWLQSNSTCPLCRCPVLVMYQQQGEPHLVGGSHVLMAEAFSEGMVNDGYGDVINIDISSVVIEAMQKKYSNFPQLKCIFIIIDLMGRY